MVSGLVVSVMVLALAAPAAAPQEVADASEAATPVRVYVGGIDTSRFEQLFHPPLEAGRFGSASQLTDVGSTVVYLAAGDINGFEREARRHFSESAAFELVSSLESADYVMVMEADYISPDFRRRMRGVLKLIDAKTGEDAFRRNVRFSSISTLSELNRELTTNVNLMEEWAVDIAR